MKPSRPTAAALLAAWEHGAGQPSSRRALALLAATDARDPETMPVGRRDAALIDLRESLFGETLRGVTRCPACGEDLEVAFATWEVRREAVGGSGPVVKTGAYRVEVRLPDSADLAEVEELPDLETARARLFARCVVGATRRGRPIPPEQAPPEVVEAVAARLAALDPQADVQIEVTCAACAHPWREPFDIVSFLWTEVAVTAQRLLGEVHELASAYGWPEGEILALSSARRSAYLQMLR